MRSDGGDKGRSLARFGLVNDTDEAMQSEQASAPKRAPRRSRPVLSRPFLLVAAFAGAMLSVGMHQAAPALAAAVEQRLIQGPGRNTVAQRGAGGLEGALHDDVRRLAMGLDRAARSTAPMQSLMPLDDQRVAIPQDLALFTAEVEQFASEPFVEPSARDALVRHGYPAVVASVAWLQEQDYGDLRTCVSACRVHELLAASTGVEGLVLEEPLADPDEAVVRRFRAAAVAWRRVLERHARDEAAFAGLVALTRRARPVEKKD